MVIRKLWISQYDTLFSTKSGGVLVSGRIVSIKLKLDFYLQNNSSFYPIIRIDTSWFPKDPEKADFSYNTFLVGPITRYNLEKILTEKIITYCNRSFAFDQDYITRNKRKLSLSQIIASNNRKNEVPVLQALEREKGIYLTFKDFLENRPAGDYVSIDKKQFGDVLFVKDEKGAEYATNKFWGFCDGKDMYITSGKNFFKLMRMQNTFEFYGIKNVNERFNYRSTYSNPGGGQSPDMIYRRKPELRLFPYQIDMETGEVH